MAHKYYGSDGLILTSINRENFDTGLSRVDCIYKCRTTRADALEPTLAAGFRVPDRTEFIIKENAKRKDELDGFTTFIISGYYGTLVTAPNATNPISSVLGAAIGTCRLTTKTLLTAQSYGTFNVVNPINYNLQVLGDTLTRKFTMRKIDSVSTLALPKVSLSATVLVATLEPKGASARLGLIKKYTLSELENLFSRPSAVDPEAPTEQEINNPFIVSEYKRGSIVNALSGVPVIVNVNRSSFGDYDEVAVTWGLKFNDITLSWYENPGPGWVRGNTHFLTASRNPRARG